MRRHLTWNWSLFWRVFIATAYFHLSSEVAFLLLIFLTVFGWLGEWSWFVYAVWVINLIPAAMAGRWAGRHQPQITSWRKRKDVGSDHAKDS